MPKYRQIHTKVIDSFSFNEMPDDFTRLVWLLLPLIVDGEGRGIANTGWIKSRMFPMRQDVAAGQIENAMHWFADHGMIVPYQFDGHTYFYIPTFKLYQVHTEREAKSILPAPPSEQQVQTYSGVTPELVRTNSTAYESASESESVNASESLSNPTFFSIRDAEKVIIQVTTWPTIPSGWFETCEKVLDLLQHYGRDETITRLTRARDDWVKQKRKDNGANYKLTNPTWINNAIAGETITPRALTEEERTRLELSSMKVRNR